jgi:RNA polymerase sigma factor (sigma-70 family)
MNESHDLDPDFRQLFSVTTSMLLRRFGVRHWEAIEDAVQTSLLEATTAWAREIPRSPPAWVYRAAHRRFVDQLRRDAVAARAYSVVAKVDLQPAEDLSEELIRDEKLRMLFVCCSPLLSAEASMALALKSVCGFGIRELASAFFLSPEAMKKRLQRARQTLAEADFQTELTADAVSGERLEIVGQAVYLIFNEGYFSSVDDEPIRDDLCGEGIRLASLLAHDPRTSTRNTHALCALLLFHAARHSQRRDANGLPLRLADQDRRQWDGQLISLAHKHFDKSINGTDDFPKSAFQIEAAIAREHCVAASIVETNWGKIVRLYDELLRRHPWPQVQLAKAIAESYQLGPKRGIHGITDIQANFPEACDCNLYAALADCHLRNMELPQARAAFQRAFGLAKTNWQKRWIEQLSLAAGQ